MSGIVRRSFRIVVKLVTVVVGLLVVLLLALWLEHEVPVELPVPTGGYGVGRMGTVWVDAAREDPFSAEPGQRRELSVWLWYPAEVGAGSRRAEYVPEALERAYASYSGVLLTHFLTRGSSKVRAHSVEGAAVARDGAPYPVVIFRSGIGSSALDYTALAEDLSSHGYVVVGADAPYSTSVVVMPDGRVIHSTLEGNPGDAPMPEAERDERLEALLRVWAADTRFLVDGVTRLNDSDPTGSFTGLLDVGALGVAGHSFGGATAAQFCHEDARCRAGVDLDGAPYGSVVREGVTQPFLFLLSDHGGAWGEADCRICADIRSAASRSAEGTIVTMLGAHHFSFSDQALTNSRIVMAVIAALTPNTGLGGRAGLESTARQVREFFEFHLRGGSRPALYAGRPDAGLRLEK